MGGRNCYDGVSPPRFLYRDVDDVNDADYDAKKCNCTLLVFHLSALDICPKLTMRDALHK